MKNFWMLPILLLVFSCDKINTVTSSFLKKKDTIDFSQVDRYPLFKNCDPLLSYEEAKHCFEQNFYNKINERIQNLKFKTLEYHTDTLLINFSIDPTGHFKCLEIKMSDCSKVNYPNLGAEIQKIIHGFEPITSAQKRDIPVTTQYTFPVIVETE